MHTKKMPLHSRAAVCCAIEIRLRPIPTCVATDCPPQRAGAPEGVAEDKADENDLRDAYDVFALVGEMQRAEKKGEDGGGDPEGDAGAPYQGGSEP